MEEVLAILDTWNEENENSGFDSKPTLRVLCEMVEREMEQYVKQDPDPFDDRHPSRADPDSVFGHILKAIFKNDDFITKLSSNYLLHRDDRELSCLACRLLLGSVSGLDSMAMFGESDDTITQLHQWILYGDEPIRSYATGLLASAMEHNDIASAHRDINAQLVPIMLKRLEQLQRHVKLHGTGVALLKFDNPTPEGNNNEEVIDNPSPPSSLPSTSAINPPNPLNPAVTNGIACQDPVSASKSQIVVDSPSSIRSIRIPLKRRTGDSSVSIPNKRNRMESVAGTAESVRSPSPCDNSSSSWAEVEPLVIGSVSLHPITATIQQRLILQYLTPVGEYQDFLSSIFENDSLKLIFYYIDMTKNKDVRLAFDALRFLAALLVHRKFALEFVAHSGIEMLMNVVRPSVASAAVSVCLFYMAYNADVMEKVCVLPASQLDVLVDYALWLLEHSYESGRCHATMFFSYAFSFRNILELFDQKDGLRKLYNCISTLTILQGARDDNDVLSDDQLYQSRQAVRNVCTALRRYIASHMWVKVEKIKSSQSKLELVPGVPVPPAICPLPPWRAMVLDDANFRDSIWLLLHQLPMHTFWKPVEEMLKLDLISLLVYVLGDASEWSYGPKNEILKNVLDVLWVCTVIPGVQVLLLNSMKLSDGLEVSGINILLGIASGIFIQSADLQMGGLNVLVNLVCGPWNRFGTASVIKPLSSLPPNGAMFRSTENRVQEKAIQINARDLLDMMWECVRDNNGIMIFSKLLFMKTPLSDADALRALACRALDGLARSDKVKQIVGKMPLIARNELHWLIREPVAQEKRVEHSMFRQHARSLIENVTGKPLVDAKDLTQEKIWRANVVANTKITYNEKELLQLIHQHLKRKGYKKAASVLKEEAHLPNIPASLVKEPIKIEPLPSVLKQPGFSNLASTSATNAGSMFLNTGTQSMVGGITAFLNKTSESNSTPVSFKKPLFFSTSANKGSKRVSMSSTPMTSPVTSRPPKPPETVEKRAKKTQMSLNTMVTEYFRKQHAMCQNPVANCPPFSVFYPHHCPEPRLQRCAPQNIVQRYYNRPIHPVGGGYDGVRMDQRYVFSRFKPFKVYKDPESEETFTCCRFTADDQNLLLGTYAGDLKMYSVSGGQELMTHQVHSSGVTFIDPSKDGSLLLTSSAFVRPYSCLWGVHEQSLEGRLDFHDEYFVEFAKWSQERAVSTKGNIASVWDLAAGQVVTVLSEETRENPYHPNRATFHPFDNLVLSDGLLWDVRTSRVVHKFDKLNDNAGGLFHPRGMEVIINTEVWDVRTYRLLHTCPALDHCKIVFNGTGDVIYGVVHMAGENVDLEESSQKSAYGRSFRTVDATDYSVISTTDVKKNIYDLCTDSDDNYLALIELQKDSHIEDILSLEESLCRLYLIGRQRDVDEEKDEVDEDETNNEDDDDEEENDDDDELDAELSIDEEDDLDLEEGGDEEVDDDDDDSDDDDDDDDDDEEFNEAMYAHIDEFVQSNSHSSDDMDASFDPENVAEGSDSSGDNSLRQLTFSLASRNRRPRR